MPRAAPDVNFSYRYFSRTLLRHTVIKCYDKSSDHAPGSGAQELSQ